MEVKLVIVGGATAQASEFAIQLPAVVGRSRSVDLPLANPLVSRRHCEIFEASGQVMVRDLGSLNGTFVGKTRVADEAAVPPGSMLTIGAISFRADYAGSNGAVNGAAAAAPAKRAAATSDSDDPTIEVDQLETLEPIGEGADDAEFNLAWLEQESGSPAIADSGELNGVPASMTDTVSSKEPTKKTVAAKAATPSPAAKSKAAPAKAKPVDDSDDLADLDDLCK
jgi:predicted component of type VI protein secretion system